MVERTKMPWIKRKTLAALSIAVLALAIESTALADSTSPIGLWKTIDDETKGVKSLVRISQKDGALIGTIEKLFPEPGKDPNPICDQCPAERKDKPILGMVILWGLTKDGGEWSGGSILDPKNGKTYRCKIRVEDKGELLTVRGYIGISLLGRSQTWIRTE